jgi:hypothetical protein
VFSDPLAAGLKPTSSGETKGQRGMIGELPKYGVLTKFEFTEHTFGVDEILNTHPATNRVAA